MWPASIHRGGIKKDVLLGFWYGNKLEDQDKYLTQDNNKQIFYKIYNSVDEINELAIIKLLKATLINDNK